MRHTRSPIVILVALFVCVSCGTTTLTAAKPSPSPTASPSQVPSPSANPTPTPIHPPDYGPPPARVDLFYLQWPSSPTWLIGYDWSGKPRATVHLAQLDGQVDAIGSGIAIAPNGSGFATPAMTFDRGGLLIYQSPAPPNKGGLVTLWSEDGQLLCGVETTSAIDSSGNGTEDFYLVRRSLTGPPVRVAHFQHLNFVSGDMGYTAVTCSDWLDRALLVRTVCCGVQGALVLRLSDGAQLGSWTRESGEPAFSPDGQEIADPTWTSDGRTISTDVKLVVGGMVLAHYGPGIAFHAFSGDNRLAVVTSAGQTQVIEVATRRVVWRDTAGRSLSQVMARPFSGDLVLAFGTPNTTQPMQIELVHPTGVSAVLDGSWLVPMSWGSSWY
jgi:hypothetical protein